MSNKITLQGFQFETNSQGFLEKVANEKLAEGSTSFTDLHFSPTNASISTHLVESNEQIRWIPAEKFCRNPNYSSDVQNLEASIYCNKAVCQALLILNWFVAEGFSQFFEQRKVKPGCLYEFKVMVNGVIQHLYLDSLIPVKGGKHIFAQNVGNSIFPCLFEKLLAKIYGSYESISQNLIEILEILSCYSKQVYTFSDHSKQQFADIFSKAFASQDLVFFRTRNSVRLATVGLEPDSIYILIRCMDVKGKKLVEFLEIEGEKWVGKFAKVRAFWTVKHKQVEDNQINLNEEGRENFMDLDSLMGVSREFIILHNTNKYHKKWVQAESAKTRTIFFIKLDAQNQSEILINAHFNAINCQNTIFIMEQNRSKLLSHSSKKRKPSNFISCSLEPKKSYLLYIYSQDWEGKGLHSVVSTYCTSQVTIQEITAGFMPEEKCFINLMENTNPKVTYLTQEVHGEKMSYVSVKILKKELGMGLMLVNIDKSFMGVVRIVVDHEELARLGLTLLNAKGSELEYSAPYKSILIFKIRGNFAEGDPFPPPKAFRVFLKHANKQRSLMV